MITYKNILDTDKDVQEQVRLWRNSPRIRSAMLDTSDITPERHRQWLKSLAEKTENIVWVAFADNIPFGLINLRNIDRDARLCNWGYYVGDDAFLGHKLGLRLLYDLHDWGFIDKNLDKMHSTVRSDNIKALHDELLAGYHVEGYLKNHLRSTTGELIGLYLIAQFRDEWMKNREKIASWAKNGDEVSC